MSLYEGLQGATVEEISNVTGGLRLLQALAAAEAASAEARPGPEAKVDLDVLWIFIGKVGHSQRACASATILLQAQHGRHDLHNCRSSSATAQWDMLSMGGENFRQWVHHNHLHKECGSLVYDLNADLACRCGRTIERCPTTTSSTAWMSHMPHSGMPSMSPWFASSEGMISRAEQS